jgi:hypothetical protein
MSVLAPIVPAGGDPFQRAGYDALYSPAGLGELMTGPAVRTARADLPQYLAEPSMAAGPGRRWFGG